jgi:cellulose synthase/poly-beta-1,6-N-acetylglucosamine synthase-like glycosyltransferase
MAEFAALLFWLCTLLVFHSYVLFPAHMRRLTKRKQTFAPAVAPFPELDILLAVHNEEDVIEAKVVATFAQEYPARVRLLVGTDACTDATDRLLEQLKYRYPNLMHRRFLQRTGKPQILNALVQEATAPILVLTDADALPDPACLLALVAPFADARIGGVQADVVVQTESSNEVALQEARYSYREMEIKRGESRWGAVTGAFGAMYALRRELFTPLPKGFIVDDFFLFQEVLRKGYQTVYNEDARYSLRISGDARVQFRRKRRIGKGNFQNLWHFKSMLLGLNRISYCFWSHKVLRWLTPFLLGLAWLCSWRAAGLQPYYLVFFLGGWLLVMLASIDHWLFAPLGLKTRILRFIRHFLMMNLALVLGFSDALRGNSQAWWSNKA